MSDLENLVYGYKTITPTDKKKYAIVVTESLRSVLDAAGLFPEVNQESKSRQDYIILPGLFGEEEEKIGFTYYGSSRSKKAQRKPEFRLGKLISRANVGERFAILWNGADIHFFVLGDGEDIKAEKYRLPSDRAGMAGKSQRMATTWLRDNSISREAKERAGYKCEVPECHWESFKAFGGTDYVEVHHIKPLSQGGPDKLENCIALCPGCHRKAHYAEKGVRNTFQKRLQGLRKKKFK